VYFIPELFVLHLHETFNIIIFNGDETSAPRMNFLCRHIDVYFHEEFRHLRFGFNSGKIKISVIWEFLNKRNNSSAFIMAMARRAFFQLIRRRGGLSYDEEVDASDHHKFVFIIYLTLLKVRSSGLKLLDIINY
jgi:hypothetical protein